MSEWRCAARNGSCWANTVYFNALYESVPGCRRCGPRKFSIPKTVRCAQHDISHAACLATRCSVSSRTATFKGDVRFVPLPHVDR